ncbi:MAG: deoxyguanosinetriphosphate triphosphohydrolase [Spirochaetes bacterium]|nr:deoxyguanosinetriphosphate triphosphohydrolase [Spirochaetota bacterium]
MKVKYRKLETIRELLEDLEVKNLSRYASLSSRSRGRIKEESFDPVRTIYMQDRDRILHSEYFRRLKHKTQVFLSATSDESYRTRLTHTLEVAQIARTIARALRVNEDLTEAIALGHDLGHTAFGHAGEEELDQLIEEGFKHALQSLRVIDILEKPGGMNLSREVRDGIGKHSKGGKKLLPFDEPDCPLTLEGEIVRVCDSIAYINHDVDDAIHSGIMNLDQLPKSCVDTLGERHSQRISIMVYDIISHSIDKPHIHMSDSILEETERLRNFLFSHVYVLPKIDRPSRKAARILKELFEYFMATPDIPYKVLKKLERKGERKERIIIDYLATITDHEALEIYVKIFGIKKDLKSLYRSILIPPLLNF